jgi:cyclophilin family peptidyl-prolyl cis-trans isomerase
MSLIMLYQRWPLFSTPCSAIVMKFVFSLAVFTNLFLKEAVADPPFKLPQRSELQKLQSAKIETSKGDLVFALFPAEAPWHVANFKYLADKRFYNDLSFHLFQRDYIIQGGQPSGKYNGPGYSLPPEFSRRKHEVGTLGMARRPDYMNPERISNGSQFHILLRRAPHMDGSYTIFGELISGHEVLKSLRKGDTIRDVTVYVRE